MYKHSIYVPSQSSKRVISADERDRMLEDTCRCMSTHFGGCTSVDASGQWLDDSGVLVCEHVTIVYSYNDSIDNDYMLAVAEYVKRVLAQDSVLYTVSGDESVTFV
jgi:hypothetical protein